MNDLITENGPFIFAKRLGEKLVPNGSPFLLPSAGALCGVAGLLLVSGTHHTIDTNTAGGMGFTAIMISWLAKFNPAVMVAVSFLIAFLEGGAGEIATACGLNEKYARV